VLPVVVVEAVGFMALNATNTVN